MKYILDFDRTLFDTKAYVETVERAGLTMAERITPDIWDTYHVRDFLYPEVIEWLQSKPKADIHILTAISPKLGPRATEFQTQKLHSGDFLQLVDGITFMIGDKGSYVKDIAGSSPAVFVDDKVSQHISVKDHAPAVHCALMQRPGEAVHTTESSDIHIVQNLHEIDTLLSQL